VALAIASFSSSSETAAVASSDPDPRIWFFFAAVLLMLFPWTLALNAATCSKPRAESHELAARVRYVGLLEDTERWAAMVLAVVIAAAVVLAAAIAEASDELQFNPLLLLTFAVLISALLIGSHLWNEAKLVEYESVLKEDLKRLPPKYQQNVRTGSVAATWLGQGVGFAAFLAMPAVVAVAVIGVSFL
jgi:hypothetical protein